MAAIPVTAFAQDAAETGAVLSGSRGTGAAARSVGNATRGALGGAADAIAATNARRGGAASPRRTGRGGQGTPGGAAATRTEPVGYTIAGNIDVLDRFDVPTWRLGNGRILRISGELIPAPGTACISATCQDLR
ncbi:hypothetical protein [Aurantiacibacter luteus]|uniref:Uncharacterized protein n=1 Tax=Aurantiacibacter luteus TaxID=1581420 RepID=A0A0G9MKI4_9SPHN|nr:hypothetical protein [Aurantiacibacter luteus]KLE31241.1 hypothetical protein AAW00_13825 [Aurantiacibacter luteus]